MAGSKGVSAMVLTVRHRLGGPKKRAAEAATDLESNSYSAGEESSGASGSSGAEWSGAED